MSKKVLILDGDSIAFRCSAAGEERFIKVTHQPTMITKEFKHRTEFKEKMQARGKQITDDYIIEDCQEPEPISFVIIVAAYRDWETEGRQPARGS